MADRRAPARRTKPAPEAQWVRDYVSFYGTENVTGIRLARLGGVSITRAVEALQSGIMLSCEKCDGPGCLCTFLHDGDEDTVCVDIYFESNVMRLEIREAWSTKKEKTGEPDAA